MIMSSASNNREIKEKQIPSRQNEEETQRFAQDQNEVSGQRREKDVIDFPRAAAIGQALIGLEFPANKNKIIQYVQQQSQNNNPDCQKMVPILEKIEDKHYENAADVTQAAGLVQKERLA
jgi:hypothetical protein